jgi:mannosyltransferase OCH1-like enzyme
MYLCSVLITSEDDTALPPQIEENVNSLKANHPSLEHRLFRGPEVVELLEKKFPAMVLESFHALRPFAYQADLARYCILYEFGGLYADLSYFFVNPIPVADRKPTVFRGKLVSSPWDTSNGLIFTPPRHKALARAIELVCANVRRRYYGLNALCPTGPALLGKAFASTCEAEEIITGAAKLLPRARVMRMAPDLAIPEEDHIHCQLYGETLVAVKRKRLRSPGLTDFGVTTGNSYLDIWRAQQVYSEGS